MSRYIFILRKNEIEIELSSNDPGFISNQMQVWQDLLVPDLKGKTRKKASAEAPLETAEPSVEEIPEEPAISDAAIETDIESPIVPEMDDQSDEIILEELDQVLEEADEIAKEIETVNGSLETSEEDVEETIETPDFEEEKSAISGLDQLIAKPIQFDKPAPEPEPEPEPVIEEAVEVDSETEITSNGVDLASIMDEPFETEEISEPVSEEVVEPVAEEELETETVLEEVDIDSLLDEATKASDPDEEIEEPVMELGEDDISALIDEATETMEQVNSNSDNSSTESPQGIDLDAIIAEQGFISAEEEPVGEILDEESLMAAFESAEAEADVRVTENKEREEAAESITEEMDDMSSMLAEFEAETASQKVSIDSEAEEEETAETEISVEPVAEVAEEAVEVDVSAEDLMAQFDAETEEIATEEMPAEPVAEVTEESVEVDVSAEDLMAQFDAETEEIATEEIPSEPVAEVAEESVEVDVSAEDLMAQFNAETEEIATEEIPSEPVAEVTEEAVEEPSYDVTDEEDLDSLLNSMVDELDQEEVVAEETPVEEPAKPEVPEAVQQIKKELEEKKKAAAVPIEAYYSSLSLKTPVDILLATASYMEKFENISKFTQKDISSRTFKAIKKPVSPNIMLAAVNKGYIEVVPDFTGTSESNEYAITEVGKEYIVNELS